MRFGGTDGALKLHTLVIGSSLKHGSDVSLERTSPYWMLSESQLTRSRVRANVLQKKGFWWLGLYGVMFVWVSAIVVERGHAASLAVVVAVKELVGGIWGHLVAPDYGFEGTVRITARRGVIYMAGVSRAVAEGMEEMAFVLTGCRVRVIGV